MFPYDYGSEAPETLGTVYVVDDDDAVRDSLKWLLEASDYRVELYDSGESFIAKYDPKAIAVLVLDVRMPGMSGLEVQEHLLARKAELPIIFITGHGDVSMAVNALKRGAVDFIEKPFEQAALKQLVERMLREARERHMERNAAVSMKPCSPSSRRASSRFSSASSTAVSTSRSPTTSASPSRPSKPTEPPSWTRPTRARSPTSCASSWARSCSTEHQLPIHCGMCARGSAGNGSRGRPSRHQGLSASTAREALLFFEFDRTLSAVDRRFLNDSQDH